MTAFSGEPESLQRSRLAAKSLAISRKAVSPCDANHRAIPYNIPIINQLGARAYLVHGVFVLAGDGKFDVIDVEKVPVDTGDCYFVD